MPHPTPRRRGFTLVELLTVIAIIAILAAMTFGLVGFVRASRNEAKARGDIKLLELKLEEFKNRYGEYPMAENNSEQEWEKVLYNALTGRWVYKKESNGIRVWDKTLESASSASAQIRPFIEEGKIATDANSGKNASESKATKFVDPWGNAYRYRFGTLTSGKINTNWDRPGFLLISAGNKYTGNIPEAESGTTLPVSDFFDGSMESTGIVPNTYADDQYRADNLTNFGNK